MHDKTHINLSLPLRASSLQKIYNYIYKLIRLKAIKPYEFSTVLNLLLKDFIVRLNDQLAETDKDIDLQLTYEGYKQLGIICSASAYDIALLFERTKFTELSRFVFNYCPNLISVKDILCNWPHCVKYLSTIQCELLVSYLMYKSKVTNDSIIDGLLDQYLRQLNLQELMVP